MEGNSVSPHTRFFTSLRQVEKRLKLDNQSSPSSTAPPPPPLSTEQQGISNNTQQTDALGTPIYLNYDHLTTPINTSTSNLQESEAPEDFLSNSSDFPPTNHGPPQENEAHVQEDVRRAESFSLDYNIEQLMQLLRLSDTEEPDNMMGRFDLHGDDGFYGRIVGVKGPKNGEEGDRLNGWIKHFLNGGEEEEPFRLAHLLLGKAALVHSADGCDGFGGFEFPSTIDDLLQNDPPTKYH